MEPVDSITVNLRESADLRSSATSPLNLNRNSGGSLTRRATEGTEDEILPRITRISADWELLIIVAEESVQFAPAFGFHLVPHDPVQHRFVLILKPL